MLPWQADPLAPNGLTVSVNYSPQDLYQYAQGYRDGAEAIYIALVDHSASPDLLVYPFAFCLRHAIELALKQVTLAGNGLNHGTRRFSDGHHLGHLWNECRNVLITIWPRDSDSFQQIQHTMESWIAIDADGEAFRYPVTNSRNSRSRMPTLPAALRHIDLQAMYEDVSATLDLLFGADTGIDVQQENRAEAQRYADEMRSDNQDGYNSYDDL